MPRLILIKSLSKLGVQVSLFYCPNAGFGQYLAKVALNGVRHPVGVSLRREQVSPYWNALLTH